MFQIVRSSLDAQPKIDPDDGDSGGKSDVEQTTVNALQALLAGQYNNVEGDDSPVGRLLNELSNHLASSATGSLKNTVQFSMLASESMASISHMADDINMMNDGAETMAAAVEEMSASINQLAESSNDVSGEAGQVEQATREGSDQVAEAISSMGEIKDVVEGMSGRLSVLEEAAGQIGGMAQSIEDISNQTKLLALNATIEAARAGEAGKGFAVVASEVKNLSEQTSTATDEIRGRIATLNTEMKEMASAMEMSAEKVHQGEEVIGLVGNSIHQISDQIVSVTGRMSEIAAVLEQQRGATGEIAERVGGIAASSKQALEQAHNVIRTDGNSEQIIDGQFSSYDGQDIPNYVLHRAKSDHLIWKKKLAIMISGVNSLNPDELADHHSCRLGKWYDQVLDPALKDHRSFKALEGPHERVHSHGRKAAKALATGDKQTAFTEYELMDAASDDVIRLLDELTG